MHSDECFYLGYFSKLIGTKGELALQLDVDSPSDYIHLNRVLVQMKKEDQQLVPFFFQKTELQDKAVLRCKFEDINKISMAKSLIGKAVYLPLNQLKPLKDDQFYYHEVIGFEIIDLQYGSLGKIKEVIDLHSSQLFVVKSKKKEKKEILIPIHDDILCEIDKKLQTITVDCPSGLIDLYI